MPELTTFEELFDDPELLTLRDEEKITTILAISFNAGWLVVAASGNPPSYEMEMSSTRWGSELEFNCYECKHPNPYAALRHALEHFAEAPGPELSREERVQFKMAKMLNAEEQAAFRLAKVRLIELGFPLDDD